MRFDLLDSKARSDSLFELMTIIEDDEREDLRNLLFLTTYLELEEDSDEDLSDDEDTVETESITTMTSHHLPKKRRLEIPSTPSTKPLPRTISLPQIRHPNGALREAVPSFNASPMAHSSVPTPVKARMIQFLGESSSESGGSESDQR